ncbi:MAG: hypothetical protein U0X39_05545 [Bacteroidales bacterium]
MIKESFNVIVLPTFRPDAAIKTEDNEKSGSSGQARGSQRYFDNQFRYTG